MVAGDPCRDLGVQLRHLEWLIERQIHDPELILYEVVPYTAVDTDRVIAQLCVLGGLDVGQAGIDPERAARVRQAFSSIVDGARARQALLDLEEIERGVGRSRWRDLLKRAAS
jgi:hypothetical protein